MSDFVSLWATLIAIGLGTVQESTMANKEPSTKGFITHRDPDPDQSVQVLCKDAYGGHVLPFLCALRAGVWTSNATGAALTNEVLGWRVSKSFRFMAKPKVDTGLPEIS